MTFASPLIAGHTYVLRYNWGDGTANTNINIPVGTTVINNTTNHVFPLASDCEYQVIIRLIVDGNVCFTTTQTQIITSWRTDAFNGGNVQLISPTTGTNVHTVCEGANINVTFNDLSVFNCNSAYLANYPPNSPITTPNEQRRWQQIIYNTPNGPPRIPNVTVNGVLPTPTAMVTGALGADLIVNYNDPRMSATENAFGVFQMDPLVVINDPRRRATLNITAPGGFGAGFPDFGDEIEITIRYWSFCNPYANDGDLSPLPGNEQNGDNPPVETYAYIRIVQSPGAPGVTNPNLCETALPLTLFNVTASPGVPAPSATAHYTWYLDPGLTTVLQASSTDNTFNPVTEGPVINRINPAVAAHTVFNRYVTVSSGLGGCASPPSTITISISNTNVAGVIAHPLGASPITICSADDPVAFTSSNPGTGGGPGGTIAYQWQHATAVGGPYVDIGGATALTHDPTPAEIAARRFFRRRERSGQCADVFSNVIEFRVDTPVTGGTITGNQTICVSPGDPANLASSALPTGGAFSGVYNYQWEESTVSAAGPFNTIAGATATSYNPPPVVPVTTFYRRRVTSGVCVADGPDVGTDPDNVAYSNVVTVTVDQLVDPGMIGNPQVLCAGQDPAILTEVIAPSGGNGTLYTFQWQESATGGGVGFAPAAGINNTATYDPPVLGSTLYYRRRVTSGICAATFSNEIQVTINPLPTASNPTGGGAVCSGNPAPDIVWTLTGTAPFNVTYTMTPGGPVNVPGHPSTTFTIVAPSPGVNTTYQITALTDGNGCVATSMGGLASVTIGGTAPSFDLAPSLDISQTCVSGTGFPQDPSLLFSLDDAGSANSVPPHFTLNYRIDGSAIRNKVFATNATGGPTAPVTFTDAELNNVAPSPHVISLVSVISPSGCQTVLPPIDLNFTVNPLPAITTQPTSQVACEGLMATYNVVASAVGGVTYQWQESVNAGAFANVADGPSGGRVYAGATTATLTIDNVQTANTYQYRVVVTANTGSCPITSSTVNLTVNPLPIPNNQTPTVCSDAGGGTTATVDLTTLQIAIDGNVGRSFAWFTGYNPGTKTFSGAIATPTSYVVTNATPVFCRVTIVATGCVAPATVTYTVNPKATITVNPTPSIVCVGDPTTFTVAAAGPGLTLRWQENGVNINDGTFGGVTYAGSTTATLSISGTTLALSGRTYRVVTTTTGSCVLNSSAATLTVNPLPTITNQTPSVCSAVPGGSQQVVDLTLLNTSINAGAGTTVTITWFQDYDVPTKTFSNAIVPGPAFGQDQQYQVTNGEDLFARVVTNATGCINAASAVYTVRPMPNNNQIKDGTGTTISTVPTSPATYNICASGSSILFQTDDTINPGSTFAWAVPPVSYPGEFVTVTASANILVMRFPNPTEAPAASLYNGGIPITVTETLNGCAGNPVTMMVHVLAAPAPSVITGNDRVCENGSANYSVPFTAGSTYSWTLPAGAVITSLPVTANAITVQMGTMSGSVTVVESNGTCLSAPAAPFAVTVLPRPTISTTVNPVCSGMNVNTAVSLSADIPGSSFNWTVLSIAGTISGVNVSDNASGVLNINQVPINTSGIPGSITYSVTPIGPGPDLCPGTPTIFSVTVNAEPVLSLLPKTICAGVPAQYEIKLSPLNLPAGTRFSWAAPAMSDLSVQGNASAGLIPMGAAGTIHINDAFVNNSAVPITATYTINAESGAGCNSNQAAAAREVVITINPVPVGADLTVPAACSNTTFNISANNITNGLGATSTYTWVRDPLPAGLTQVIGGTGTGNISERLSNLTGGQLTAVYVVTPVSSLGCTGATYRISVPVNPEPVGADVTRAAQCSDSPFSVSPDNISNGLGGTSTYAWTRNALPAGLTVVAAGTGTGLIAETLQNLTGGQLVAGYTVTPTSAVGCPGATYIVSVPINPEPVGANVLKAAQCSDAMFSFNPQTEITNGVMSTFAWTAVYDGGSGNLTGGAGTGTGLIAETLTNLTGGALNAVYTVTPTASTGTCLGSDFTITVPINPEPVGANSMKAAQCSGVSFTFNPQADITNGVTSTFSWTAVYDLNSGLLTGGAGAGIGSISETLVNLTGVQRSAVYTVVPTGSTGSCIGTAFTITVPVNPQPVGANSTKAVQCSDAPFSFDPQGDISNAVASTFTWTAVYDGGSGQLTGGAGSGTGLIAETLTNTAGTTRNAVYTVIPRSSGGLCFGTSFQITVPVRSEPVGANAIKSAQCSDAAFSFNPQAEITNGVTSNFAWTASYDGGSGNLTGGAGAGTGLIAETLTNLTGGALNAVYTVTPSSSTGACPGSNFTITVPINPEPLGSISTKAAQCSGVAFSFNPQADITNGVTSTFTWTAVYDLNSGLLTGGAGSGTGSISETLVNLTGIQRSAVYTVVPTATTGNCPGTAFTITVPVNPQPIGANATKAAQCSDTPFSFDPQGDISNGVNSTFTWTASYDGGSGQLTGGAGSGTGLLAETLNNVSGTTRNAVYTIIPRSSAGLCFGASFQITIPVRSEPVGTPSTKAAQCSGIPFSFNPQTDITNGVTSTFAWTAVYDGGSGNLTGGAGAGTGLLAETLVNLTGGTLNAVYTVTPTSSTGSCLGSQFNITVPVVSQPVGANSTKADQCSGVGFTFNPQVDITNGVTSTFAWTAIYDGGSGQLTGGAGSGTGSISETLINVSSTQRSAVYTVVPTSSVGGCPGVGFDIIVPVNPQPVGANITRPAECSNIAFNVSPDNISNGLGGTSTYTWVRNPLPPGLTQVIAGTGAGMIAETLQNLTGGSLNAVYVVTPTSTDGCLGASYSVTVPVNPEPVGADITRPAQCSNVAFSLSANNITNGLGGTSTYTWVRNLLPPGLTQVVGGASGATIAETLENLTGGQLIASYVVTPTSGNGCPGTSYTVSIPIDPQPVGANVTRPAQCSGVAFSLSPDNISNGLGGTSTYTWARNPLPPGLTQVTGGTGSGPIAETLQNLTGGQLSAIYVVTPTSGAGCQGNTYQVSVPIDPAPVGTPTTTVQRCSGDAIAFDLSTLITNAVTSVFRYTVVADFPLDLSPSVFPGTFDRTVASNAPIGETFSNYSNHDVTLTYTVTPISDPEGCTGGNFTFKVVYHPEPVGSNLVEPNCNTSLNHDIQSQITNGVTAEFTYTVSSSDEMAVPTPPALDRVIASDAFITDAFVNLSGSAVTVTYTIQAFNKAFPACAAAAQFTYDVTIAPKPVGITDTKADVCSDVPFSVDPQGNISPPVASTFTWTATYDGSPIPGGTGVINATFNNTSNAVMDAVYTITPTAVGSGCVGVPFTITVPIQPEPVIDPALAVPVVICSTNPLSTNPTNVVIDTNGSSVAADSYVITLKSQDVGLIGTPTVGTFPAVAGATSVIAGDTYSNTTAAQLTVVYTVVPVSSLGCSGNPFDITVRVNPEPVLSNPGFPAVCSTNTSVTNIVNIVLGTNGTSVNAASYELMQIQYSTGGPFGGAIPPGLTPAAGNTVVTATGDINLVKNDKYTNTSAGPITIRYTIQGTSASGCTGGLLDYDVVVNPEPTLDPLFPTLVCSGDPSNVTLVVIGGSVAATSFNINSILFPGLIAGGSNAGIGNNKPANAIFNDVYVNTTNGVLTATYKISPVSADGCMGPEGTITLDINPSPDLANNLNRTVCTDATSGIVFSTTVASVPAANYNLIDVVPQAGLVPDPGNAIFPANSVGIGYVSGDRFTNPTNGPLTVAYTVAPVSGAPCVGPQEVIVLTVEPTMTATPINNKPTVCSGSINGTDLTDIELISPSNPTAGVITFNYTAVSSIGTQITGFSPSLNGLAENFRITDNLVNNSNSAATVTYTITPVASGAASGTGCAGVPAVVVVTVEPKPRLVATSLKTVCEGVGTAISLTSPPTIPSAGTIEFLLVSAVATGGVTGASANGTVFNDGGTLNDMLSNPTSTSQTVTYTLRPRFNGGAGCQGDDAIIVVTVNPRPVITATPQADICNGEIVDIILTSDVALTVPTWTATVPAGLTGASGGAGDRIFQILFNQTTGTGPLTVTYDVTPNAAGCAGTVLSIPVVVNPLAKVIGTPATTLVCHGSTLNVPLNSNVTAGVTYAWTIVDSSGGLIGGAVNGTGNLINQTLTNTTGAQATLTYTITPTGPGGCVGQDKLMIVTVSPEITASWLNTPSPDFICKGSTEYLVLNIGGRAPFSFTYNDGGGPIIKTGQPPVAVLPHIPLVNTTYTLTSVTDGLGCTTGFGEAFVVNVGDTDPNFSIISPAALCSPNEVSFQYNQVAGTIYTWRFGDAPDSVYQATTTVPNRVIKHTYTNLSPSSTLNYPVTMQTELPAPFPGCFKSNPAQTVTIYPNPILNVIPNRTEICSGESITFTNSSVGTSAPTIQWSFRVQGQVPETVMGTTFNMTYAFTNTTTSNPITYEVIYRAGNASGCNPAPVIMPIQVYRYSVANFTVATPSPLEFINGESLVDFTNTSSILDAGAFQYDWVFGPDSDPANSASMAPGTIRYVSPGPKDVSLTVTNLARPQCQTTIIVPIDIVLPPLIAKFDVNPKESCFPAKISVDTNPLVTEITGDVIEWTVLDENNRVVATSSGVFPEFNLPTEGEYTVKLRTSSSMTGQSATAPDVSVTVFGKPFASFDARPDVVFVPDTEMQIFNFSTDPDDLQFTWDFGDGDVLVAPPAPSNTTSVPLGTHSDRTKGTYEEPIHLYKIEGIYDLTMIASFDHGNNVVCRDTLKQQVQARQGGVTKVPNAFTPSTSGPSGGQSGNGTFNDVFLPIVKGADEYNLQIYDRWGNLIFESNSSQIGWDGYNINGQLLPAGVYVYKLTVRLSDGQRSTQVGDVTMIR